MTDTVRQFRDFFVSLKLTVVLLALGIVLVFASTLDQVNLGIWAVQEKWFRSFFVLWKVGDIPIPVFPGGYFIGGLLLINLLAAHIYRFRRSWKKAGIELTHAGLILLLLGELFTGLFQEDYSMRLERGVPKSYSESFRDNELAIVDVTDAKHDDAVVIPEPVLAQGQPIQHAKLPFRVVVKEYHPNAFVSGRDPKAPVPPLSIAGKANQGIAGQVNAIPAPITYKQDSRNLPIALVELVAENGSLGTWLVASRFSLPDLAGSAAQRFEHNGRSYTIALRFARSYKPFTLTLLKFSHDRYAGTEIAKNFSSSVRVQTLDGNEDREVLIYMNNPLRFSGFTFYQASYDPENPNVTILQVVRNPSWLVPYIACAMMTLGLTVQFGIHLFAFVKKRRAVRPSLA